ncbi:uncharacterized protein LOC133876567 [Alnus glutinosa]|uniref:uncharacterized protein LOC133876567 n=1 Tax=Alnus glutinosa TaxID=3517 RepID=UPI002D76B317|nr:uncharacterized protein LOC133876567 [Alnus glutinosa]
MHKSRRALYFQLYRMSCFPAKVIMATLVALFLLVGGIHIPPTSAPLPNGGRKSLSLDGASSTKTIPRSEDSSEGLNITRKKIVFSRSLRGGGSLPPPTPIRSRTRSFYPMLAPPPPYIL